MVSLYSRRQYPAIVIGSASGALVHLCCALGIPWLPQTFFIPVARSLHPDEPIEDMEWGKQHAYKLLEANPELDRKSTRLNSSHANISYAVFCLKKKKKT